MSACAFSHSVSTEVKTCEEMLSPKEKKERERDSSLPAKCGARHNWPLFKSSLCKTLATSTRISGTSGIIPSRQVEHSTFTRGMTLISPLQLQ